MPHMFKVKRVRQKIGNSRRLSHKNPLKSQGRLLRDHKKQAHKWYGGVIRNTHKVRRVRINMPYPSTQSKKPYSKCSKIIFESILNSY